MDIFEIENQFFRGCDPSRLGKFLAHAKLYEMSLNLPGHFAEFGVFKGSSFSRFRKIAKLFHPDYHRKFLGFDVFGKFPDIDYEPDRAELERQFVTDGDTSVTREYLLNLLKEQGLDRNVELIQGDVRHTVPAYIDEHQETTFAIVNLDMDLYGPTKETLEHVFPRVARGGVVILDDYEGFPGAKKAVDEYLEENNRPELVRKFPWVFTPCYLIKE
jgi:hypothetical protein